MIFSNDPTRRSDIVTPPPPPGKLIMKLGSKYHALFPTGLQPTQWRNSDATLLDQAVLPRGDRERHDEPIVLCLLFNDLSHHCAWTRPARDLTIWGRKVLVGQWVGGGPRVVVSTAAFHARVRGSVPGLGGLKETKIFLPHPRVKVSIVGSLRDREVACSASDRQGSNFESCVWRTVSSQSSHHPQEVLLAQFSLYVHKGGLKPDLFHFIWTVSICVRPK